MYIQNLQHSLITTPANKLVQHVVDAYVNNADLWDIHLLPDNITIFQMQANAQLWSALLQLSEGYLKPLKCF